MPCHIPTQNPLGTCLSHAENIHTVLSACHAICLHKIRLGPAYHSGACSPVAPGQFTCLAYPNTAVRLCFGLCRDSYVAQFTENYGNPIGCNDGVHYACIPIAGCAPGFSFDSVPASPGPGWRTVAPTLRDNFGMGVTLAANMSKPSNLTVIHVHESPK